MKKIKGKIIPGHGVASGKGKDPRYPKGTLRLQAPYFKERGLDLDGYYLGTLNVDIAPKSFKIGEAKYFFEGIAWSDHIPPENFYFFEAALIHNNKKYDGLVYMPDPKTKVDHEQLATVLELILPPIEGITTDDLVTLEINEKSLQIA